MTCARARNPRSAECDQTREPDLNPKDANVASRDPTATNRCRPRPTPGGQATAEKVEKFVKNESSANPVGVAAENR